MTVNTDIATASYTGNGSTAIFSVPFYFLADADLKVSKLTAAGVSSVLVLNSDYTVTGAGVEVGGSITTIPSLPTDDKIYIERNVDAVQQTEYPVNGAFPAASHERALDRLTMLIQQCLSKLTFGLFRNPLGNTFDLGGGTLINSGTAVNAQDVPSLVQVQALVTDGAVPGLSGSTGSSLVGFTQSGAGAVLRTLQSKEREIRTAKDNGAVADGVTNDGPAIASAVTDYSGVKFSPGSYANTNTAVTFGWDDVAVFDHGADIANSGTGTFTNKGTVIRYGYNPDGITATGSGTGKSNHIGLYVDKRGYGKTSFSGIGRDFAIVGAIARPVTAGTSAWAIGGFAKGAGVVALYGQSDADTSTTTLWGGNMVAKDNGLPVTQMWGLEVDVNVTYAGNVAVGVDVVGGSTAAPANSAAYRVGPVGTFQNPVIPWGRGFYVDDGAATTALEIGASMRVGNTGAISVGSPSIDYYFLNAAGNRVRAAMMYAEADGGFRIRSTPNDVKITLAATTGGVQQDNIKIYQNKVGIMTSGNPSFALDVGGTTRLQGNVGFYNSTPIAKQTVTGSKGANAALTSLLQALQNIGLIADSST